MMNANRFFNIIWKIVSQEKYGTCVKKGKVRLIEKPFAEKSSGI